MNEAESRAGARDRREDRRIRALRGPRPAIDPGRALGHLWEEERTPSGELAPALTLFLAGAECPFTCVYCDLWRHTLEVPTPPGALPEQVEAALGAALAEPEAAPVAATRLKLYNASNFFDSRAVPRADLAVLAELARPFERVVVECHPKLVGEGCLRFGEQLEGRLEVAMGLETIHPRRWRG